MTTSLEQVGIGDKTMQLMCEVVTGEDFPTGRGFQIGLTSGAETHAIYGRNERLMIYYHQSMRPALASHGKSREAAELIAIRPVIGPARLSH